MEHHACLRLGLPTISFCVSVRHGRQVATPFAAAGLRAAALNDAMPAADRAGTIAGVTDGSVQLPASCDLLSV
ncbi:MAG: hypothetical protein NZ523_01860 [Elioraea sp.]|nr:hypothetical protein [Elioraea sp.]